MILHSIELWLLLMKQQQLMIYETAFCWVRLCIVCLKLYQKVIWCSQKRTHRHKGRETIDKNLLFHLHFPLLPEISLRSPLIIKKAWGIQIAERKGEIIPSLCKMGLFPRTGGEQVGCNPLIGNGSIGFQTREFSNSTSRCQRLNVGPSAYKEHVLLLGYSFSLKMHPFCSVYHFVVLI